MNKNCDVETYRNKLEHAFSLILIWKKNVCTWDKNPKSKAKLEYPNLEFWALKVVLIKKLYVLLENKKYICSANIHAKAMGATTQWSTGKF